MENKHKKNDYDFYILTLLNRENSSTKMATSDDINKNKNLEKFREMEDELKNSKLKKEHDDKNEMQIISKYISIQDKKLVLELVQEEYNLFLKDSEKYQLENSLHDNNKFVEIYNNITKNKSIVKMLERSNCRPSYLLCRTFSCGDIYVGTQFWPAAFACAWLGFWCGGGYLKYHYYCPDINVPISWSWDF